MSTPVAACTSGATAKVIAPQPQPTSTRR
jgi:hypothetical protein